MSKKAFWITKLSTKSKKRHDIKTHKEEKFMASKGQKFKKVPLEERLNAVKEKIQEGKSYTYLAQKYEVSWNTVESWVRTYRRDEGLDIRAKGRPKKEETIDYKERYEILKKFQEYLKEVDQEKK